ncbi:hypothetical protein [Paenibacillus sp. YIM B09110]|uniref:hypothetical protein n=1 Tax=Paenibacillus sp. YIM B09110 TaxID=3126102 RepID=UPI00301D2DD6
MTSNPNDANTSNPVTTNNNTNTFSPTINVNPTITVNSTTSGQGLLTEFNFVPLDFDNSLAAPVRFATLNSTPLVFTIDNTSDRVWLQMSIQWRAIAPTEARFHISRRRQGEIVFTDICTTDDSTNSPGSATTSLTCVDDQPILTAGFQQVEYQVTVEDNNMATILIFTGNGILTGAEIEANSFSAP